MNYVNTHKPTNRTLAVIDGGLNLKASVEMLITAQKPRLLDQVRQAIRTRHYSQKTEEGYVHWIRRFIFFHNKRHPGRDGRERDCTISFTTRERVARERFHAKPGVERYFVSLPRSVAQRDRLRRRSCSGQEVEKAACGADKGGGQNGARSSKRCSVVNVDVALRRWTTPDGMLPLESQGYRFSQNHILVREGKGDKDRHTMLPTAIRQPLLRHLEVVKRQHDQDLKRNWVV